MIRRFLETLTGEELDRVLTTKMRPGCYSGGEVAGEKVGPCLVGTAFTCFENIVAFHDTLRSFHMSQGYETEGRYDDLCLRFTTERINTLIRNQALQIQLSRIPKAIPTEGVLV